jgi:hypothetical protein
MNSDQKALWERWQGFLSKIDERKGEILTEAEEGLAELIGAYPEDPMPLGNALQGLRFRFEELKKRVEDTWEQQVEPKFEELDSGGFRDAGLDAKQDFLLGIDEAWAAFQARMNSVFYKRLRPRAEALLGKPVECMYCRAALDMPVPHESVSVTCPFCHAVNQILPETAVAIYFNGAPDAVATEAALPLRYEIERFRIAVDRKRRASSWANESVESLDKWDAMERAYWEKYAAVKGQAAGLPPDVELVKSRMEFFRKYTLMTNQAWRKAKGL